MALPRIPKRGGLAETAKLVTSQFNITTPPGIVVRQSPTGTEWRDDRHQPFPARITGDGQSSSSDTSSETFFDRYDWEEVVALTDGTFVTKEQGRTGTSSVRYALERNGNTSVPIGSYVTLYAGPGEPDYYYFDFNGDASSDPQSFCFEVDCENQTITVTDCDSPTTSSGGKTGGASSNVGNVPKGGNIGGGGHPFENPVFPGGEP